jgi:hypothetical protein
MPSYMRFYAVISANSINTHPYGQKTHLQRAAHLRCLSMVVAQEPTQQIAALNRPLAADVRTLRKQQNVALSLVIALSMVTLDMFT